MNKIDRLLNRVEPFAALFWSLGKAPYRAGRHATPDPDRQPGITPTPYKKHVLIWSQLVQLSTKTRRPPPLFLSKNVCYLSIGPGEETYSKSRCVGRFGISSIDQYV